MGLVSVFDLQVGKVYKWVNPKIHKYVVVECERGYFKGSAVFKLLCHDFESNVTVDDIKVLEGQSFTFCDEDVIKQMFKVSDSVDEYFRNNPDKIPVKEVEVVKEVIKEVEVPVRVSKYSDTWIDRLYNRYRRKKDEHFV